MKKVTLRDLAEMSGVSPATVSLVLNNRPEVSHKTALRVREIITNSGYDSLTASRRPRQKRRTKIITLVMANVPKQMQYVSVYSEFIYGIEAALRSVGYTLVLRNTYDGASLSDIANSRKQDGMVLVSARGEVSNLFKHIWHLPGVEAFGLLRPDSVFDRVVVDNRAVSRLAADYLYGCGLRNLAYIGRDWDVFHERCQVFCERVHELGGNPQAFTNVNQGDISEEDHAIKRPAFNALMDQLLATNPRPAGALLETDSVLTMAYQYLLEHGLKPGHDLKIVSVNNERSIISSLHPTPAVIDIQAELIGRRTAEQVLWRIEHPTAPRVVTIVEPKLLLPEAQ